jgi:hypothetical protein
MASVHDFSAAHEERHKRSAVDVLERIAGGAQAVLDLARSAASPGATSDIDALGALMADAAGQIALLCDGQDRVEVQYIRRLCEMLREQLHNTDALRVEALASAIESAATRLAQKLDVE